METDFDQYLTFILGGEEYGVDILSVQEIRGWEPVTELPNTPEYLLGVINLRGIVIPIVDMRVRFELESADFTNNTVVVIVNVTDLDSRKRTVGMVVDEISDVYDVKGDEVGDMPNLGGVISSEFIKGVATVKEKMVILLEVNSLINAGVLDVKQVNEDSEILNKDQSISEGADI